MHRCVVLLPLLITLIMETGHAQNFREFNDYGWSPGLDDVVVLPHDIDGDGVMEFLVGHSGNSLHLYRAQEPSSLPVLRVQRDFLVHQSIGKGNPALRDIDGDGLLDLLIGNDDGTITLATQSAVGVTDFAFVSESWNDIEIGASATLCLVDLDNDGLLDILVGESSGDIHRFAQRAVKSMNFDARGKLRMIAPKRAYPHPCLVDIDGDGLWEMFLGATDKRITLLRQHASVKDSFYVVTATWGGIDYLEHGTPHVADIDNDGLLDMLCGTRSGYVYHFEQNAPGDEQDWIRKSDNFLGTWDFGIQSVSVSTDLDGDGRIDVLRSVVPIESHTSLPRSPVEHYRQKGVGDLRMEYVGTLDGILMGIYDNMCVTDLEGDGRMDLLTTWLHGRTRHYRQTVAGAFTFELVSEDFLQQTENFVFPPVPLFKDLDGNGKLDLLLCHEAGNIDRYEQGATATSFALVKERWFRSLRVYPYPCILDYDNDGILDVFLGGGNRGITRYALTDVAAGRLDILTENFGGMNTLDYPEVTLLDMNDDGKLDIIVGDILGGLSLYLDMGPNSVAPPLPPARARIHSVYPQPGSGSVTVQVELAEATRFRLLVIDMLGRVHRRCVEDASLHAGGHAIPIDLHGMAAGNYRVVLETAATRVAAPLMLLR